jgi:hypothetical protein
MDSLQAQGVRTHPKMQKGNRLNSFEKELDTMDAVVFRVVQDEIHKNRN